MRQELLTAFQEAITIQSLQVIAEKEKSIVFKTNDCFVLCHVTDRTVDVISYEIANLSATINLREITPGSGGIFGWKIITRRFADFLQSRFGGEDGWDIEVQTRAIEYFESTVGQPYLIHGSFH